VFVPVLDKQEPAGHAVHEPAPMALKKPGAQARPTPVSVVDDTTCDPPVTVPVHDPDAHGFGDSVRIAVPLATPAPVMTMPMEREPDATEVTDSALPVMEPVTPGAMKPAAQNAPAGHCPEHVLAERPVAAPYLPAGQGTGATEPRGQ